MNWWTGRLAWNLTGRSGKWDSHRGSCKPLHISTQERLEKPPRSIYPWLCVRLYTCAEGLSGLSDGQLSHVWLSETPWTIACQVPLSVDLVQARILECVVISLSDVEDVVRGKSQGGLENWFINPVAKLSLGYLIRVKGQGRII